MRSQLHQFLILVLSIAAHLLLALGFGSGGYAKQGTADSGLPAPEVFSIALNRDGFSSVPMVNPKHAQGKSSLRDLQPAKVVGDAPPSPKVVTHYFPLMQILTVPEPHYFSAKELTEKPIVLQDVSPNLALNLPGVSLPPVIINLLISEYGEVDRVVFENPNLPEKVLALVDEAFKNMKFQPGVMFDVPVNSQLKIEVSLETIVKIPEVSPNAK